jgi:hypothetical protein
MGHTFRISNPKGINIVVCLLETPGGECLTASRRARGRGMFYGRTGNKQSLEHNHKTKQGQSKEIWVPGVKCH